MEPDPSPNIFFTAAIRTYNASSRIASILERLKNQQNTASLTWEVLVVDNNSTDTTVEIVAHCQANWLPSVPFRYVNEPKQGASHARLRAIQDARGQWIGFLDDDNWPDLNWVAAICKFAQRHPQAGAVNGNISGLFEVEPPQGFEKISAFFPVIQRSNTEAFCFNTYKYAHKKVMPPGAGLAIRKEAWCECVPQTLVLQGPIGSSLNLKGEDIEALMYLSQKNWKIWFNPEQNIEHYISRKRFERDYLMRFFRGIGLSRYRTRLIGYIRWQRVFMIPVYLFNDLKKLIFFWLKYRKKIADDIVLESQLQMLLYTIVSPFYLLISKSTKKKPVVHQSNIT